MESSKLWILKSKGTKSVFGGNSGYADQLESCYIYNTTVKNHDKIMIGDYILIVDKKYIKGFATVEDIKVTKDVPSKRFRCPVCGSQEHYSRKSISPKYKCRKKHEFNTPVEEDIVVNEFEATYSSSFTRSEPGLSVKLLEKYYINRNIYYSIQQAKVEVLIDVYPNAFNLLAKRSVRRPSLLLPPRDSYVPSIHDSRAYKILKSYIRPKQDKFRDDLIKAYSPNCMLTGCNVLITIEASHICPYRGDKDNHLENGILLRRDLHALYDADLIGIHPDSMVIFLDPTLNHSYFSQFHGRALNLSGSIIRPSKKALEIRWYAFLESSQTV